MRWLFVCSLFFAFTVPVRSESEYPALLYEQGKKYWLVNDEGAARNEWIKYLTYCRHNPEECDKSHRVEVDANFKRFEKPRRVENTSMGSPLEKPLVEKKEEKIIRREAVVPSSIALPESTVADLAREAAQARGNGQFEHALRLFKMAEAADPSSEAYGSEITELKKMME